MSNAAFDTVGYEKDMLSVCYRVLSADDAEKYKRIRLESLTVADCRYFAADRHQEEARTIQQWRNICVETCDRAVMGAFLDGTLIGAMSVERWEKDKTRKSAYYRSAYVQSCWRSTAVAGVLYVMLDNWAITHGCERAVFAIRADNTRWLAQQIGHGAKIIDKVTMRYANGDDAQTYILENPIQPTVLKRPVLEKLATYAV